MNRTVLHALLFALALAAPLLHRPAQAQIGTRAYAPEDLWTLDRAGQIRVISQEYREQSSGRTIPSDQLRFYLDQVRLSRWSFSRVRQDIAKSLGHPGGGWNPAPLPGDANIRCESRDNRTLTCRTPWQSRSRLVRQLSDARCIEGQTWYSGYGQVTVLGGCRAEFAAGAAHGVSHEVRCESVDGRYRECPAGFGRGVRLLRQLSQTRCLRDRNWGKRGNAIWVNSGCRGVFLVESGWGGIGGANGSGYSVTCSSINGRYATCAWNARYGTPALYQQLSSDVCRAGYSWGYNPRAGGLWVNHGCRARFVAR